MSGRRTRVRLARRQPRPTGSVRRRRGSDGSSATVRQATDWGQLATVVAALAAAGGLIYTGWGTYYSVEVARDQLAQSQEESANQRRKQASMISVWGEGGQSIRIANRSREPAYQVDLAVRTYYHDQYSYYTSTIKLGTLPPCSQVALPADLLLPTLRERLKRLYAQKKDLFESGFPSEFRWDPNVEPLVIGFWDANGVAWLRKAAGPLVQWSSDSGEWPDRAWLPARASNGYERDVLNIKPKQEPTPYKNCGA